ncbi:MAG: DUF1566 domain-containing protein [bacterium]|nr:DUF1566 domain-containing protein [bacterium]
MNLFKRFTSKNMLCFIFLMIFLFSASVTAAHDKVVVIPLFDDQIGAPSAKTGQTATYAAGDDGFLQMGVSWPAPRFIDNGDGTVTDGLTGLTWLKNANCFGTKTWLHALASSTFLAAGQCGLNDSSVFGDWRMPNVRELHSLNDFSNFSPALPTGHPFTGVQSSYYWSSTTHAYTTVSAWYVHMSYGGVYYGGKDYFDFYVWPVRGGN